MGKYELLSLRSQAICWREIPIEKEGGGGDRK